MLDGRFCHLPFPPCSAEWDELNFCLVVFCLKVVEIWISRTIRPKHYFSSKRTKNTDELKICLVWFSWTVWKGQFALKFFAQNIWKENIAKYWYVILHEHYCTFEQLVGKILIEIESAVANVAVCWYLVHCQTGAFSYSMLI